jgi:hypothetical protein
MTLKKIAERKADLEDLFNPDEAKHIRSKIFT